MWWPTKKKSVLVQLRIREVSIHRAAHSTTKAHCFLVFVEFLLSTHAVSFDVKTHDWVACCNLVVECTDTTHVDKRSQKQLNCNNWNCSPATVSDTVDLSECSSLGQTTNTLVNHLPASEFFSFIHDLCVYVLLLYPKWAQCPLHVRLM